MCVSFARGFALISPIILTSVFTGCGWFCLMSATYLENPGQLAVFLLLGKKVVGHEQLGR